MTILEIKTAIASIFELTVADLTLNGLDLGLVALNQVRNQAEQIHDFNFQRKLLTLAVNTVTGGSLDNAVLYGTSTPATIKQIVDFGVMDERNNFIPMDWTTVEEGLERMRIEDGSRYDGLRYPSDGEVGSGLYGARRLTIANNNVYLWPKPETGEALTLVIEGYVFQADWTANSTTMTLSGSTGATGANTTFYRYGFYNAKPLYLSVDPTGGTPTTIYAIWYKTTGWVISLANDIGSEGADFFSFVSTSQSPAGTYANHGAWGGTAVVASADADVTSDIWTTQGAQYLIWASVVYLNNRFKYFVARQEGNLPPPTSLAANALESLRNWDVMRYEQRRRHNR